MPRPPSLFRPGDLAPISGVYRVIHKRAHRADHDALVIRGEELPPCRLCGRDVYFEVGQPTSHLTHDWDFAGPSGLMAARARLDEFANLRQSPRYSAQMPLLVRSRVVRGRELVRGYILDISEGGASAVITGELGRRNTVALHVILPAGAALSIRARLRYRKGQRCGFQFTRIARGELAVLRLAFPAEAARAGE